mmetsp:Transcript_8036/g.9976  ORF Transcript_8036/g.9976 Transcript_8036/m.9976 type:complete len:177 (-) Transcript_8036:85-615(-)
MSEALPHHETSVKRLVFISASFLVKDYERIPLKEMQDAVFFFGSDRRWVFPANEAEIRYSKQQPTKYLSFSQAFKDMILEKESKGLVCWLKPEKDYRKVSDFFCGLTDLSTGKPYAPLQLSKTFWEDIPREKLKYTNQGIRVYYDAKQGSHDYSSVMELLYQSNPSLHPILAYSSS